MTKPMKAYMVREECEGHACIVFATNSATARREGGNELGVEWEDVDSCTRQPAYDTYAPGPVPPLVLLKDGWWFECRHCGRRVSDDMDCEIEDEGLNPDDFEPVAEGQAVYCSHECAALERRRRVNRQAAENALCEWVYTKFPGCMVKRTHVCDDRLEPTHKGSGILSLVEFTFPGGKYPVTWVFPEDNLSVSSADLDAWEAYKKVVQP